MDGGFCVLSEEIGEEQLLLASEAKTGQSIGQQFVHLGRQIHLALASILNDDILIEVIQHPLIHGKVFDDVIHVDAAHPDYIPVDGIYVVDQMEGKERDVNALPSHWLQQVQQGLAEFDHAQVVHAEDMN